MLSDLFLKINWNKEFLKIKCFTLYPVSIDLFSLR